MAHSLTYLDYNATAPLHPSVIEAVLSALQGHGNASSVHRFGRLARRLIENARAAVATCVNAAPEEVVFTSGGTEANDLALTGAVASGKVTRLVVSAIEHPSILDAARAAGVELALLPCSPDGVVGAAELDPILAEKGDTTLVVVMLANNETGVVQPIRDVVRIAKARGALVLCDAVQGLGKIPVDVADLGVDLMTLSAHKIGGPQGVGAVILRNRGILAPRLRGGGQEFGLRSGTENVSGIVGFGRAAELVNERLERMDRVRRMRDDLEARVAAVAPDAVFFGAGTDRLPNTSYFSVPGPSAETQVIGLDLAGVAVSSGSACSSGKVRQSHVLAAMGVGEVTARNALRVSLGWETETGEIDRFVAAWSALYERVVARARPKRA